MLQNPIIKSDNFEYINQPKNLIIYEVNLFLYHYYNLPNIM